MQNPFTKSAIIQSAIAIILVHSFGTFAAKVHIEALGFNPNTRHNQLYVLSLQRNVFPTISLGLVAAILLNEATKKRGKDRLKQELKGLLNTGRISPESYASLEFELEHGQHRSEIGIHN